MTPDVSVVIPTLNRRALLEHVLPALARQSYPGDRVEILLCDAGSTDGTAELIDRLAIPNVRWLPGPDTGRAGARNRGIAAARGDIIVFTDADIVPDERWLEEHAAIHRREPRVAVVGCEVQVDTIEEIAAVRRDPARRRTLHPDRRRRLSWLFFLTGNASVRRDVLVEAGGFDEGFRGYGHEDLELGYRLARRGVPIRYHAAAVNYHCHPVSLDTQCEKMQLAGASTVYFYRKHRDPRIALRLGFHPLSWVWHALMPEGGRLWRACRRRMAGRAIAREIALQHAYLTGIKTAWRSKASVRPSRILVVRIDKVGDLVLATPAIRNLRDAWPSAHLSVLVSPQNAAVLEGWDGVDELIAYDRRWPLSRKFEMLWALRARRFDAVLVLSPMIEGLIAAFATGARIRGGVIYSRRVAARCLAPLLLSHASVMRIDEALARGERVPHEVEQSLTALDALGVATRPASLEIAIDASDRTWAGALGRRLCGDEPFIALHLSDHWFAQGGSGHELAALVGRLLDETHAGSVVVTHGAADERAFRILRDGLAMEQWSLNGALVHRARGGRVFAVGGVSFGRWAAILDQARLVISRDTGALHVAAALGKPVVAIYEARTFAHCSQQWAPWMVPHRSLRASQWPELTPAITAAAMALLHDVQQPAAPAVSA